MLVISPEYDKMIENYDFSNLPEIVGDWPTNLIEG